MHELLEFPAPAAPLFPAPNQGQRRDRRFLVNQPARLTIPGTTGRSWNAHIRNISRRGMQFVADGPLPAVPEVMIEWNGRRFPGSIRYQQQDGDECRLGIELSYCWDALVPDMLAKQAADLRQANKVLTGQTTVLSRQAALIDLTYDTILVTSPGGFISSWNHGAEQMYGWLRAEALGRNVHELLQTSFPNGGKQVQQQLFAEGRWEGELAQVRKDGSRIVVASRWALQRGERGQPAAIMAINSDITAQKRAEEELVAYAAELERKNGELAASLAVAREASDVKSRFLASVSHELRTPLNGIIGFSELLHDGLAGPVNEVQKDSLGEVLNCSRHLLGLINQVLDLSKIEAGKVEFRYQTTSLEELLASVVHSVRALAARKGVDLRLHVDQSLGPVQADPARLKQVAFNYLSNALKFTPAGGLVTMDASPDAAGYYRITVADTGIGIQAADLPRLFSEFGQLSDGRKAETGTGLGLAITRSIVEAQGGRVGVESVYGEGSRFYAVLPVNPEAFTAQK